MAPVEVETFANRIFSTIGCSFCLEQKKIVTLLIYIEYKKRI